MNHIHLYVLRGEFQERVFQCLYRTVHISFDNDIQFLEVTNSQAASNLLQTNMFLRADGLLALQLLAFVRNLACLLLGWQHIELIACLRSTIQAEDSTGLAG